jgi:hypothetical protein
LFDDVRAQLTGVLQVLGFPIILERIRRYMI